MIVWMVSVVDIARIIYLVVVTLFVFQYDQGWIWIYVFTITVIFPLLFYIIGFEIQEDGSIDNADLFRAKKSVSRSSRDTELSESK